MAARRSGDCGCERWDGAATRWYDAEIKQTEAAGKVFALQESFGTEEGYSREREIER